MPRIVPNLWFDTEAEEAAAFYTSTFPDSRVVAVTRYGEAGPRDAGLVMTVEFELAGQRFVAINGGPDFAPTEALSLEIRCETQEEIDHYWSALTAGGGEESVCGWLKDRYGFSWQVTPIQLEDMILDADQETVDRVMTALLQMRKLDIAELERAAEGAAV